MKSTLIRWFAAVLLFLPAWVAPALTVVLDDNYPPYSFRDQSGALQGISVDLWTLWSRKTHEPVRLDGQPWARALETMEAGRADVLDTVFFTPARAEHYDFTGPYTTIQTAVFHRDGLTGILGPKDLKGYLVGVKAGDAGADALRAAGIASLVEFPDYGSLIDAAGRGEVLAFCMDVPPAVHLLLAKGLGDQFRQAFVLSQDGFRRAVSRFRPETLILVDRGFSLISAQEVAQVEEKWRGAPLDDESHLRVWPMVLVVLAVVVLLIVVFVLRRQVKRRQGQLAGTEERLKSSEDRARALIAALPDLLYILDQDGLILETLATVRNHLYHNPERYVGQRIADIFGAEVGNQAREKMAALVGTDGVATIEADLDIRGDARTFEARIVALADGRFLSIVRDVSDGRRAWRDDLHRNKLESLGLLAGGLAHDFNNSLGVIQGFVSLARVQLRQPERALASLDKAVQATRRAAGLTGQLRVLAHGGEVNRTVLSVRDLAEEAASFALVGSPCVLQVEADGGPWNVEADADQLSQVFNNLVLNAVQAMPGGGTVTLVFRRTSDLSPRVVTSVVDQGTGIAADHLNRIFDPYFTTKPRGTGLGLSVVHAVVGRHGGTLEVDTRLGRGTAFTVTLPAASGDPGPENQERLPFLPEFQDRSVLIMEDEPDLRDLIVEVCLSLGFQTTACRNGTEAVAAYDEALAANRPFDLLVSDLLVPGGMGGRELVSRLRSRPGRFRALAVTGFSVDRSVEDFQNQGFDVIVGKPFTIEELKARIVELMKSPWKTAPNT